MSERTNNMRLSNTPNEIPPELRQRVIEITEEYGPELDEGRCFLYWAFIQGVPRLFVTRDVT